MQPSSQKYVQPFERESSFELQTKSIHKTGREAGQKGPPVHHSSFITNTSLFQSYRWPLLSSGWVGAEDERSTTCIHSLCSLWKHERGCSEEGRRNHWHLACELHSTTPAHVQTWLWLTTATSDFLLNIWTREDDTMRGGRDPPHTPCPCVLFPARGGRMCHTAQRHARETWKRIFGFVESAGQRAAPLLAEEAQRTIYMLVLFYEFLYLNWVLWLKSETKASSQKNPFCSFCTSGEKVCLWALFKAWTFFEERKTRNKQEKKNQTNHHAHTTKKRSLEKEHVCPNCTHVHAHTHTHAHTQKQRPKGSKLWSLWSIYKMRKGSQKKKEKEDRVKCTRVTDMYTP